MVRSARPILPVDANPRTKALRPKTRLKQDQIEEMRSLRKQGYGMLRLARMYGISTVDVRIALAAMRTRKMIKDRYTLNVGKAAYDFVRLEQYNDETIQETVDRILTELEHLRELS